MKHLYTYTLLAACWVLLSPNMSTAQGSGKALRFDGVDDYVDIPDHAALDGFLEVTIEGWLNWSSCPGGSCQLVSKWNKNDLSSHSDTYQIGVFADGTPYFGWRVDGPGSFWTSVHHHYVTGNTVLQPNRWHHLAVTRNATSLRLYLNGVLIHTSTGAISAYPFIINGTDVQMGGEKLSPERRGNMMIDEVRIWNRALTQDEIRHKMCEKLTGTEPGLVAYWRIDEGVDNTCPGGQDVCDASGNGHHGVKF